MKSPHLLRVDDFPEKFAPLVEAARALGLRIGWLELGGTVHPVPPVLEAAAGLNVLRAVEVGEGRTVAVKPLRGEKEQAPQAQVLQPLGDVAAWAGTLRG